MVGREEGFDPALLAGLVLGGKLVRAQARLAPHQRKGKLLLRLAQLDCAALQNNDSDEVTVIRVVLVEEEVPLQNKPTLVIGRPDVTLQGQCCRLVWVLRNRKLRCCKMCANEVPSIRISLLCTFVFIWSYRKTGQLLLLYYNWKKKTPPVIILQVNLVN